MLHIIGIILKIIGILLAAGLGLLILLIGIVLLVPVRYEISAEFPGIEKVRESTVQAGCSWLLHLISVRFSYEEEKPDWRVRIAWKVFREESEEEKAEKEKKAHERRRKKKDSEKRKRRKKRNSGKRDRASENAAVTETKQQEAEKALTDHGKEKVQSEESGEMNTPRSGTQTEPAVPDVSVSETKEEAEKESLWEKASEKISTLFEKIKYTFRMICDKIKVVCETKEKVMDFLENEVHRTAYSKAVKELVWLKRFLKPKKVSADLHFGFEDPYYTGLTLAGCGMIYPFVGEYMNIRPDFENKALDGTFYMKGKLRAVHLVILAVRLFSDRNIRTLYRDFRKII